MKSGASAARAADPPEPVRTAAARLKRWLFEQALPIWWQRGADLAGGGFFDRLDVAARPTDAPKRLRVQARQSYVYALAKDLGWDGPAETAARHGLDFMLAQRAEDRLYHLGAAQPVAAFDGMGLLYDQAFVLLALAAGCGALDDRRCEPAGADLRDRLRAFGHPKGGYAEQPGLAAPLFANPNMHLFESAQAWLAISPDPAWAAMAGSLCRLALERLIDRSGVLLETYGPEWSAPEDPTGRTVWPGHLYEWAFLLMNFASAGEDGRAAALRLIDVAERTGVDAAGFAIFALDGSLSTIDRGARLWSQTERLRACARAASLGYPALWEGAAQAASALEAFLDVPQPGLWRDWRDETGVFREEPAPASSLYHIAGAIAELDRICRS